MVKVMMSVGEASGDMQGASVARALMQARPDVRIFGMGGEAMRAAGVEIVYDIAELGVFGVVEILKKLPKQIRLRRLLADMMEKERPDVLVVVDYGGFHIPLAKAAKARGIPVVYYIPPKAWLYWRGRAKDVADAVERVAAIFPFEAEVYREAGANVTFVGNPLLDIAKPSLSKEEAYRHFGADPAKPLVLLLPGSRIQEIKGLLPAMLGAAEIIAEKVPDSQFFLPIASTISREVLQNSISGCRVPVRLTSDRTYDLMQIADVAIAASGTATLETSLLGVPTVIIYKVAPITYLFGKILIKIPDIGLPNIVAGRRIVPELLQDAVTSDNIAREALAILTDDVIRGRILQDIGEMKRRLGEGGAVERVAQMILEVARVDRGGIT
ncbi:MAG: lipid-A-disaccharide synthase [Negativicutes bacterium]|nr:lipid-A-disaccharide synthase [Negativicutes bacterium]